jgi:hypothetical protein
MRRRQFLRRLGTIVAGAAVSLRGSGARAAEPSAFLPAFRAARGRGCPLTLATVRSLDDEHAIETARDAIRNGADHELAVRLLLVEIYYTTDRDSVQLLTNARTKAEPPALALIDGEQPRLVREAVLDSARFKAGLERFLRAAVPLTGAWLAPRVALLSSSNRDVVDALRDQLADGELPGALGQVAPAVVVLEAVRRKRAVREKLLADLLSPAPPPKLQFHKDDERMLDCGLGAQLIDPFGRRFANVYAKRSHGRGRNHAAT